MAGLRITRQQLIAFLGQDHDAIRQFEMLFGAVSPLVPNTVPEMDTAIGSADAKAQLALDELESIRDVVDLLVVHSQELDTIVSAATPAGALNSGTAIIDFGAFPGSNEASVVVTGQASIAADSEAWAWLVATVTGDHTANDAAYAAALVGISTGALVAGTGFTIYGRSVEKMQGTFNLQWAWA